MSAEHTLEGEVALVTGGNAGIGLGMARGLAEAGADVCIWGRRRDRNDEAVEELAEIGVRVAAVQCDVASESQVADALNRKLRPRGTTFEGVRGPDEQDREFLASNDIWFRNAGLMPGCPEDRAGDMTKPAFVALCDGIIIG